ncbi:hypothetical protein ACTHOQ_14020 [Solibacillus silvestris]|uniref:hypothetical protein n=1 Tax=Solibacillus silvestris TaxID=76853 RepID=UPI003F7F5E80
MARTIKEKVGPVPAEKVSETIQSVVPTFTKDQLVTSRKYIHRRDALNALLDDSKRYTFTQVDKILKDFDKGVK